MKLLDLFHVEDFGQRNAYGRIIRIDLHDVGHVVPPLLHDAVATHVLGRSGSAYLLAGIKHIGIPVPEDGVIRNPIIGQQLFQLRPYLGMPSLVLGLAARF